MVQILRFAQDDKHWLDYAAMPFVFRRKVYSPLVRRQRAAARKALYGSLALMALAGYGGRSFLRRPGLAEQPWMQVDWAAKPEVDLLRRNCQRCTGLRRRARIMREVPHGEDHGECNEEHEQWHRSDPQDDAAGGHAFAREHDRQHGWLPVPNQAWRFGKER